MIRYEQRRQLSPKTCVIKFVRKYHSVQPSSPERSRQDKQGLLSLNELRSKKSILTRIKQLTKASQTSPLSRYVGSFNFEETSSCANGLERRKSKLDKIKLRKGRDLKGELKSQLMETWKTQGNFLPKYIRSEVSPKSPKSPSIDVNLPPRHKPQHLKGIRINKLVHQSSKEGWLSVSQEVYHNCEGSAKKRGRMFKSRTIESMERPKEFEISPWAEYHQRY